MSKSPDKWQWLIYGELIKYERYMTEQEELLMEQESKYDIIEFVEDALRKAINEQDEQGSYSVRGSS